METMTKTQIGKFQGKKKTKSSSGTTKARRNSLLRRSPRLTPYFEGGAVALQ